MDVLLFVVKAIAVSIWMLSVIGATGVIVVCVRRMLRDIKDRR